jgi:uncharacterized protein YdcH (DUF465 family)
MDQIDQALVERAAAGNPQIRRLYLQHKELSQKIAALDHRGFLTEEEKLEMKQLKKEKLRGKDELIKLVSEYATANCVQ